jgi:uncharacterized protein DUF6958
MPKVAKKPAANRRVTVENVNVPGYAVNLDSAKYESMRRAVLDVLPKSAPGLTQAEIRRAVVPHLAKDLFPAGAKAAWWAKMVQLDLEAKGIVDREPSKPLRWHTRVQAAKKAKR